MNSTDTALGALFDELLLPLHLRLRAEGRMPFPVAPDVTWLSYYVRRRHSAMVPADFCNASCADVSELETRLAAYWTSTGRSALAAGVAQVGIAARAARAGFEGNVANAEVSPYVYAMF